MGFPALYLDRPTWHGPGKLNFGCLVKRGRKKEVLTLRNTRPFNALGLPTISIPYGFTQAGLPIGMQITGPPQAEATVLRLVHAYEQATDWHNRRPNLA